MVVIQHTKYSNTEPVPCKDTAWKNDDSNGSCVTDAVATPLPGPLIVWDFIYVLTMVQHLAYMANFQPKPRCRASQPELIFTFEKSISGCCHSNQLCP